MQVALKDGGLDLEEARRRLARHPRLSSALNYPTHHVATTAANLVGELSQVS